MSTTLDNWLKKLNKKQTEAVTSKSLVTYLLAGAGCGKTTTLTTKIAYLIEKQNLLSKNILALTFTNKAANQMKDKVLEIIGEKSKGLTVLTFHALGNRILKKNIELLPFSYNKNFIILDSKDCVRIIKIVLKESNVDTKSLDIKKLRQQISILKRKDNLQIDLQKPFNQTSKLDSKISVIEKIKNEYQAHLQKNNLVDFDDLILYTYQLLKEYPQVKQFWQQIFKYILVDEFQDTDFYQYQILTFLSEQNPCVFVVGDPDQNIYSFRGARFANSQLFLNKYNPQIYILEQNYRSSQKILDKANMLISYNLDHPFKKQLKSVKGEGQEIFAKYFADSRIEAQYIIQKIKTLVNNYNYRYQDFAILYRNNSLGIFLEKYFISALIPYKILGNISFYQSKIVKDLVAYLNLALSPKQDFYLRRIINVPKRKIGQITLSHLDKIAQQKKISLFEVIKNSHEIPVNETTQQKLQEFYHFIEKLHNLTINNQFENICDIIEYIDKNIQYSDKIINDENEQTSISIVEELKLILKQVQINSQGDNLKKLTNFLEEISLSSETNQNISSNDKINLATIHKVKGLEFKVVFVAGLEKEIFDNVENIEESRRLAYVAITRAKEKLFLTAVLQRMLFGQNFFHQPSIFFKDMGFGSKKTSSSLQSKKPFQKGDQVKHNIFGLGIVLELKENIIIVEFLNSKNTKNQNEIKAFENSSKHLKKI